MIVVGHGLMNGCKKYSFQTKRLGFRFVQKADLDYLVELNVDPDVRQFFPDGVQNRKQTEERMQDFMSFHEEHGLPCFLMFELETNEFVGRCGFGPIETGEIEVGYLLHKRFWGKGYASEALMFLLEWAKENIQTDYIIAFAPVEHIASSRVMQKCGMLYYKNDNAKGVACCFYRIRNT